ncbi:hypothetical protein H072_9074 [Dactylellina haptotyla CBS 200.50]|uniref:Uncharacterized protein n=1 Tax=Dactylellina haptotyla (strain CBS 200.50) TaxID=1284197 RepID=S8BDL7_DACHA|nr:hypothetical protein H072_9074 [Dactylellina haptotyla CBS 200.50]
MVLSIPPPSLVDLLPAFLAHIPASFASASKPPPSLPPLLTPITRSRLTHLSFNLSQGGDSSWLSLLTWSSNSADGQSLHEHLASQDYYFLHQPPSPGTFSCKGYRRLDSETLQSLVAVPELELLVLYQFITDDVLSEEGNIGNAWKVHDVRLADDEEVLLPAGRFHASIDTAEGEYRSNSRGNNTTNAAAASTLNTSAVAEDDEDDDDYWGRYDDEDTESSAGDQQERRSSFSQQQQQQQQQQSPVQIAASMLARRMMQDEPDEKEEDEYYARYANVEPVLDQPATASSAAVTSSIVNRRDSVSTNHTSASMTFEPQDADTATPLTAFTHPSAKVSPTITTSHPQKADNKRVVADLESAAEVHTQSEVAIQQHVSTSVKSLYRLWKAGGMDAEDFGRFLEREVEVLRVIEEAGELGS